MTQPTQPSLTALLNATSDALRGLGVEPANLGVAIVGPTECYFGEIAPLVPAINGASSPFDQMLVITNPKRISRVMSLGGGRLDVQVPFTDFDMVVNGEIHIRPIGGFMLSWVDEASRLNYLRAYVGFLESRIRARAKAQGIVLPGEE